MAYINDAEVLALEHARLRLIQEIRNKGVEVSNNAQIGELDKLIKKISAPTSIFDKTIKSIESMASQPIEAYMFNDCSLLEKAYFPNSTSIKSYAFQNTFSLNNKNGYFPFVTTLEIYSFYASGFENIVIPLYTGTFGNIAQRVYVINNSTKLKRFIMPLGNSGTYTIDLLSNINNLEIIDAKQWTTNTNSVKASVQVLIIRDDANVSPATGNISTALANATIYVPQALLNDYKTASNWSMIADQIVALEGSKYEPLDWWKTEDWFLNMYHYTSVLEEDESEEE